MRTSSAPLPSKRGQQFRWLLAHEKARCREEVAAGFYSKRGTEGCVPRSRVGSHLGGIDGRQGNDTAPPAYCNAQKLYRTAKIRGGNQRPLRRALLKPTSCAWPTLRPARRVHLSFLQQSERHSQTGSLFDEPIIRPSQHYSNNFFGCLHIFLNVHGQKPVEPTHLIRIAMDEDKQGRTDVQGLDQPFGRKPSTNNCSRKRAASSKRPSPPRSGPSMARTWTSKSA